MDPQGNAGDSYSLRIGIRTVSWSENSFFVNGRPFYFKGCGRYEYEDVSGVELEGLLIECVPDFYLISRSCSQAGPGTFYSLPRT